MRTAMGVVESADLLPLVKRDVVKNPALKRRGALNPVSRPLDMSTSPPSTLSLARASHPATCENGRNIQLHKSNYCQTVYQPW
jgi:hypothetical protein